MGSRHSLGDAARTVGEIPHDAAAAAEEALLEAKRRLGEGRDRFGVAAADTVDEMRDEAEGLAHSVRKSARRRMRRRARRRARALRERPRVPALVASGVAVAAAFAAAVLARRPLSAAAAAGGRKITSAAKRASRGTRKHVKQGTAH